MNRTIYLLVGIPASGKSWVCEQIRNRFEYIPHDTYLNRAKYLEAINLRLKAYVRPLLIETPFSISELREPLIAQGNHVECVFIIEDEKTISERWSKRPENKGKVFPRSALSRQNTYTQRVKEYKAFSGTSQEVLEYMRSK